MCFEHWGNHLIVSDVESKKISSIFLYDADRSEMHQKRWKRVKQCTVIQFSRHWKPKCANHIYSQWDQTELMNRFCCSPFTDWLERNDMDCFFSSETSHWWFVESHLSSYSLHFCPKILGRWWQPTNLNW